MKKIIFITLILWWLSPVWAQQIRNNSFEHWHDDIYYDLDGYITSVIEGVHNVSKIHGQQGMGISLQTIVSGEDTIPGYFINFNPDTWTGGQAYSEHVDTIKFYYKLNMVNQDTALVLVQFSYQGNPVGGGIFKFPASMNTNTWTEFSAPTHMPAGIVPDTLMFGAASSNAIAEIAMELGSQLMLDNVRFYNGTTEVTAPDNGNFENWTQYDIVKPDSLHSSLDWYVSGSDLPVYRVADHTDGSYGIKLSTFKHPVFNDTVSGMVTNVNYFDIWNSLGGDPLTDNPIGISYDIKGHVSATSSDPAWISFVFKQNGNIIHSVGDNFNANSGLSATTFTHKYYPLNMSQTPDTIAFAAGSSMEPGDYIILDNMMLEYPAGVTENIEVRELKAFPVPAKDLINLKINARKAEYVQVSLTDENGRRVYNKTFDLHRGNNIVKIPLTNLPAGMYIYTISDSTGDFSKKIIKK